MIAQLRIGLLVPSVTLFLVALFTPSARADLLLDTFSNTTLLAAPRIQLRTGAIIDRTVVDPATAALGGARPVRFQLQGTGAATDVSFVYVDAGARQLNLANGTDAATRLSLRYDANGAGLGANLLGFQSLDVIVNV